MSEREISDPTRGQREIEAIDEILQVMYWLKGERLASEVTPTDLVRWIQIDSDNIPHLLARMAAKGLVEVSRPGNPSPSGSEIFYKLTRLGTQEGARRFADEFADMTKPGHGECGDPDCECHQTGNIADCRHA